MAQNITDEQAQKVAGMSVWRMIIEGAKLDRQDQNSKYPWAEWTDGQWWMIEKGEDFDIPASSMRSMIMTHAKRHSMKVQVIKRLDILIFKFSDNG